jgi:predicted RNA-binding Zn-ribbon protein involved in translation (DUF1610 family)
MNCPECGASMVGGFAELHASLASSLLVRATPVTLVFEATPTFEVELLEPARRALSFECDRCGTIAMSQKAWLPK